MVLKKTTYQQKDEGWVEQKRTRARETSGVDMAILQVENKDAKV